MDEHDRGRQRAPRAIGEALAVEQALSAAGLVTGKHTEATFILLSNAIRGAFAGPVTGRVKPCAAGESASASASRTGAPGGGGREGVANPTVGGPARARAEAGRHQALPISTSHSQSPAASGVYPPSGRAQPPANPERPSCARLTWRTPPGCPLRGGSGGRLRRSTTARLLRERLNPGADILMVTHCDDA